MVYRNILHFHLKITIVQSDTEQQIPLNISHFIMFNLSYYTAVKWFVHHVVMKELNKISLNSSGQNCATSICLYDAAVQWVSKVTVAQNKKNVTLCFQRSLLVWHKVVLMFCFCYNAETTTTNIFVYSESVSSEHLWTTWIFQYSKSFFSDNLWLCNRVFVADPEAETDNNTKLLSSLCMFAQQAETVCVTRQHAGLGSADRWLKSGLVSSSSGKKNKIKY